MTNSLTYEEIVKEIRILHLGSFGFEYQLEKIPQFPTPSQQKKGIDTIRYKTDFANKHMYRNDYGYSKEEFKEYKAGMREANKELSNWKKGVRALIKIAKKGPDAFTRMGKAYHGNGPDNNIQYFWSLYKAMNIDDIIKMGAEKSNPVFTSYVDGSFTYELN